MDFYVGQRVRCVTFARTNVYGVILEIMRGTYDLATAAVRIDNFHADGAPLYTQINVDDLEPADPCDVPDEGDLADTDR